MSMLYPFPLCHGMLYLNSNIVFYAEEETCVFLSILNFVHPYLNAMGSMYHK